MTTKDVNLKQLLARLHKMRDSNSRLVVHEIENLMRESDAWRYKYENALRRIQALENQLEICRTCEKTE